MENIDWRENIHLFLTDGFNFVITGDSPIAGKVKPLTIQYLMFMNDHDLIKDCTLIARPISDMTDVEKEEYESKLIITEEYDEAFIYTDGGPYHETDRNESPESFLYLLKIGILDHNKFNTTNVIWRYRG